MKMTSDFACGQILFSLKSSQLNYVVKETPYSAYITIRKKFLKSFEESETNNVDRIITREQADRDTKEHLKKVERENLNLRERNTEVERDLALMRIELEEMETKNHDLLDRNSELEDTNEELYRETSHLEQLNREIEHLKYENLKVKTECENTDIKKENLHSRLVDSEKEICKLNNFIQESDLEMKRLLASSSEQCNHCEKKTESLNALENHLENQHDPISEFCEYTSSKGNKSEERVSSEQVDVDIPSTSKCGKCESDKNTECDPKTHIDFGHDYSCDLCDFRANIKSEIDDHESSHHCFFCPECNNIYRTQNKLKMHTCKLEVINPESGSLYSKAWLDGNGCNSIFCSNLSQEIAVLHSEQCVSNTKTCCFSPYTLSVKTDSITHLEIDEYTYDCKTGYREILWATLSAHTK